MTFGQAGNFPVLKSIRFDGVRVRLKPEYHLRGFEYSRWLVDDARLVVLNR